MPSLLVETLYAGLRVVSTDYGAGIHDILLDGRYGTIIPMRDPQAMAMTIEAELGMPW